MSIPQVTTPETLLDAYHTYMAEENYTAALLMYHIATELEELPTQEEPAWYEDSSLFHA